MTTRDPAEIETVLLAAAGEMEALQTADDVKRWWSKYYTVLGHRRLGRLLLGQPLERLLERTQRGTAE